ncbi:MAG: hypothetical protein ABI067_12620 [Leifsonia sp.]
MDMKITKEQFLKDLAKGWKGIKFLKERFFDTDWDEDTKFTASCAIGAACYGSTGSKKSLHAYLRALPGSMENQIIDANNDSRSKAEVTRKIAALTWPRVTA